MRARIIKYDDEQIEYDEMIIMKNSREYLVMLYFRKLSFLERFEVGLHNFFNNNDKLF